MTIKKTVKVNPTGSPTAASTAGGGATIANRFKLDMPDAGAKKAAEGGTASTVTGVAGIIALAVAAILAVVLWKHWEFLMPW